MSPVLISLTRRSSSRRVLVLDDARDGAARVAQHAAVAGRRRRASAVSSASSPRARVGDEVRERLGADQRHVAAQHEHAMCRPESRASPASRRGRCRAARPGAPTSGPLGPRTRRALRRRRGRRRCESRRARARAAARTTCSSSGRPASGCSTFGSAECMRLPWPAARTTTETGTDREPRKPC